MQIRCPKCGFDREIETAKVPSHAVMATCPRCGERFRFRNSDGTPVYVAPVATVATPGEVGHTDPAQSEPDSAGTEAQAPQSLQAPQTPLSPLAQQSPEHPEDDPLPPGAVTIRNPEARSPADKAAQESDSPKPAPNIGAGRRESETLQEKTENKDKTARQPSFFDALQKAARKARDKGQQSLSGNSASQGTSESQNAEAMDIPWEEPQRYSLGAAFYHTLIRVMFSAPRFFSGLAQARGSLARPLFFYLLLGVFQTLVERMWFHMSIEASAPSITDPKMQELLGSMAQSMSLPLTLLMAPLLLALQVGFFSGVFFLMLRLVQPDRAPFPIIFRVVAYSAAPTIVCIVPLVGPLAGSLWFAVCCLVGCKHALNLPWSRILLALGPLYAISFAVGLQVVRQLLGG